MATNNGIPLLTGGNMGMDGTISQPERAPQPQEASPYANEDIQNFMKNNNPTPEDVKALKKMADSGLNMNESVALMMAHKGIDPNSFKKYNPQEADQQYKAEQAKSNPEMGTYAKMGEGIYNAGKDMVSGVGNFLGGGARLAAKGAHGISESLFGDAPQALSDIAGETTTAQDLTQMAGGGVGTLEAAGVAAGAPALAIGAAGMGVLNATDTGKDILGKVGETLQPVVHGLGSVASWAAEKLGVQFDTPEQKQQFEDSMGNVALVKASDLGLKVKAPVQAAEGAVKEGAVLPGAVKEAAPMEAGAMPSASEAVTNAMPKAEVPPEIMAIKNDTSAVPSFREKKAGIDESTKNSLQRTNPDDVSEIFSQAELHKTNPNVNPSPMKVIANKSADVISDIDKKISTSNAIADSTLLPTTNVDLIPVVKSFTDNIEKELGGKIVGSEGKYVLQDAEGRAVNITPANQKVITDMASALDSLREAPTATKVNDVKKLIQSMTNTADRGSIEGRVLGVVKRLGSDIRKSIEDVSPPEYAKANAEQTRLIDLKSRIHEKFGDDLSKGESVLDQALRGKGRNTQEIIQEMEKESGINFLDSGRVAKLAYDYVGDANKKSLLQTIAESHATRGGAVGGVIGAGIGSAFGNPTLGAAAGIATDLAVRKASGWFTDTKSLAEKISGKGVETPKIETQKPKKTDAKKLDKMKVAAGAEANSNKNE